MGMRARDISSRWGYLNLALYKLGKGNTPWGGWEYEAKLTS
jgi:hypothetical protein